MEIFFARQTLVNPFTRFNFASPDLYERYVPETILQQSYQLFQA